MNKSAVQELLFEDCARTHLRVKMDTKNCRRRTVRFDVSADDEAMRLAAAQGKTFSELCRDALYQAFGIGDLVGIDELEGGDD